MWSKQLVFVFGFLLFLEAATGLAYGGPQWLQTTQTNTNNSDTQKRSSDDTNLYSSLWNLTCNSDYVLADWKVVAYFNSHYTSERAKCFPLCTDYPNSVVLCRPQRNNKLKSCDIENKLISQINEKLIAVNSFDCRTYPVSTTAPSRKKRYSLSEGRPASPREYPWHAGIYSKTTSPYMQICGGTLVSSSVVLSAAHCFWSDTEQALISKDLFAVAMGKIYRPWSSPRDLGVEHFDVIDIKIPPRFQGSVTNYQDDIAIVFMSSEVIYFVFSKATCVSFDYQLEKKQLQPGEPGRVAGWGLTSQDGEPSQVLQVANFPYIDIETCIATYPANFKPYITSEKICAGYSNGTALCKGDSGGGLVFSGYGNFYLRGIVSTAPKDGHGCNVKSWATFTHVLKHEHFLKEHLNITECGRLSYGDL